MTFLKRIDSRLSWAEKAAQPMASWSNWAPSSLSVERGWHQHRARRRPSRSERLLGLWAAS
jgi:hypothetical protein